MKVQEVFFKRFFFFPFLFAIRVWGLWRYQLYGEQQVFFNLWLFIRIDVWDRNISEYQVPRRLAKLRHLNQTHLHIYHGSAEFRVGNCTFLLLVLQFFSWKPFTNLIKKAFLWYFLNTFQSFTRWFLIKSLPCGYRITWLSLSAYKVRKH